MCWAGAIPQYVHGVSCSSLYFPADIIGPGLEIFEDLNYEDINKIDLIFAKIIIIEEILIMK